MAWEVPGPGYTFGKTVIELGFTNVYFKTSDFELRPDVTDTPGWFATTQSKRFLLEEYRAALMAKQFLNRSKSALSECLDFKYDKKGAVEHAAIDGKNDPSGARVNHGDMVIADALDCRMLKRLAVPEAKKKVDEPALLSLQWRREYHAARDRKNQAWSQ